MGADFIAAIVITKANNNLHSAMKKCLAAVHKCTTEELQDWGEETTGDTDIERRKLVEYARDTIKEACNAMTCEYRDTMSFAHAGYQYYISGGMSWGDDPTDTYKSFDRFSRLPQTILKAGGFE